MRVETAAVGSGPAPRSLAERAYQLLMRMITRLELEPGALIVQTASASFAGPGWHVVPVEPTPLAAGFYWLALSFKAKEQSYRFETDGVTEYRYHDAEADGFLSNWGTSNLSFDVTVSMYGTYQTGGGP